MVVKCGDLEETRTLGETEFLKRKKCYREGHAMNAEWRYLERRKGGIRCREKKSTDNPLKELRHAGVIFLRGKQNMKLAGEKEGGDTGRLKHDI